MIDIELLFERWLADRGPMAKPVSIEEAAEIKEALVFHHEDHRESGTLQFCSECCANMRGPHRTPARRTS